MLRLLHPALLTRLTLMQVEFKRTVCLLNPRPSMAQQEKSPLPTQMLIQHINSAKTIKTSNQSIKGAKMLMTELKLQTKLSLESAASLILFRMERQLKLPELKITKMPQIQHFLVFQVTSKKWITSLQPQSSKLNLKMNLQMHKHKKQSNKQAWQTQGLRAQRLSFPSSYKQNKLLKASEMMQFNTKAMQNMLNSKPQINTMLLMLLPMMILHFTNSLLH